MCLVRETTRGLEILDGHLRADLDRDAPVPVAVLDLTDQEAETVLATLDPLAGMAVPEEEALEALLATAMIPDEALLRHVASYMGSRLRPGHTDPDRIPARPRRPSVRSGQLFALGRHRLLCGDATSPADVARLMGGERAAALWTDPPFGVSYVGKTADALTLQGDDRAGLGELLSRSFACIDEVLRPGARLYVVHPGGALSAVFINAFLHQGWRLHQKLVWVKDRMVLGHTDYHSRHEDILYGYTKAPGRWGRGHRGWYGGNDQDSVLEVPRPAANRDHPTAKPVELVVTCLANSSGPGTPSSIRSRGPARPSSPASSSTGGDSPWTSTPSTARWPSAGGRPSPKSGR